MSQQMSLRRLFRLSNRIAKISYNVKSFIFSENCRPQYREPHTSNR